MKLHSSFSDFSSLSVDSLASGRRKGTLSVQELGEAVIAASAAREPRVRAWSSFVPGAVRKSYEELGSPIAKGPLWGIPFGVKDIIDVKGMPTEYGSSLYDGNVARTDASCVALLRAAGAVPVGKTVTAEFAFSCPGPTTNPWNEKHTPGGSSSGSAAVAVGMVPFALGTQTGGSVIRPAAYCGVVGFKTSRGAVARADVKAVSETLDTVGWFARSVEDAATIGTVLLPWTDLPEKSDKPLRVALVGEGGLGALSAIFLNTSERWRSRAYRRVSCRAPCTQTGGAASRAATRRVRLRDDAKWCGGGPLRPCLHRRVDLQPHLVRSGLARNPSAERRSMQCDEPHSGIVYKIYRLHSRDHNHNHDHHHHDHDHSHEQVGHGLHDVGGLELVTRDCMIGVDVPKVAVKNA